MAAGEAARQQAGSTLGGDDGVRRLGVSCLRMLAGGDQLPGSWELGVEEPMGGVQGDERKQAESDEEARDARAPGSHDSAARRVFGGGRSGHRSQSHGAQVKRDYLTLPTPSRSGPLR